MKIKSIKAKIIPNSRHKPAIEIIINKKYKAAAPSGASTGSSEVKSFPHNGIEYAVDFINKYNDFKLMKFEEFEDLNQLEEFIPTIGGNSVIALQFAILKAISDNNIWKYLNPKAKKLPTPVGNVIGGGAHTHKRSNDIQEFLLIPKGHSFYDKVFVNKYIHKRLKQIFNAKYMTDEGAWITSLSNVEVLDILYEYLSDKKIHLAWKLV